MRVVLESLLTVNKNTSIKSLTPHHLTGSFVLSQGVLTYSEVFFEDLHPGNRTFQDSRLKRCHNPVRTIPIEEISMIFVIEYNQKMLDCNNITAYFWFHSQIQKLNLFSLEACSKCQNWYKISISKLIK